MEIWLVWRMDIRDKVVCYRRGFQTMLYSPVALPIYYTCRIILQSFIVSASVAIIRNEILRSRLLYTCACKRSDTADMLCPANRIGFLVIPAYQASVRQSATGQNFSISYNCITLSYYFRSLALTVIATQNSNLKWRPTWRSSRSL